MVKLLRETIRRLILENYNNFTFDIANQMISLTADSMGMEYNFDTRNNGVVYTFESYKDLGIIIKEVLAGNIAFEPYTPPEWIDQITDGAQGEPGYNSPMDGDTFELFLFRVI